MAKATTNKNLNTAKKVVKEVAPTKSQIKRGMKKSGFHRAVPYLTILFALVLAICFITVRLLELNDGAGVVGYYIQLFFCGLFGGAAFFIPLALGFVGVLWCILHFKEASPKPKSDEDAADLRKARRRTISKTVLSFVFILLFSTLLGVFADYDDLDVTQLCDKPIYRDEGQLSEVIVYKNKNLLHKVAQISLYGDRIVVEADEKTYNFEFEQLGAVTVLGKNKLNIYTNDKLYQIKGSKRFNALKYVNIFHRAFNIREEIEDGKFLGI